MKKIILGVTIPLLLYGSLLLGFAYTNMVSVHILNSLIDSTPIGQTTPSTGKFTTAQATSGFTGNLTGNVAGNASSASSVPWTGVTSPPAVTTWNWSFIGQTGQPNWLWGTVDATGVQWKVWNPSNFNVANAANAGISSRVINDLATPIDGRIKIFQTGATCTTPANSFQQCSQTLALPGNWYGGSYNIVCSGGSAASGHPHLVTVGPTDGGHFLYIVETSTANVSGYNFLTCFTWGN